MIRGCAIILGTFLEFPDFFCDFSENDFYGNNPGFWFDFDIESITSKKAAYRPLASCFLQPDFNGTNNQVVFLE